MGVVRIHPGGGDAELLGGASGLLESWFGSFAGPLPIELSAWVHEQRCRSPLARGAAEPFAATRGDRRLIIRHLHSTETGVSDELLIEEHRSGLDHGAARRMGLTHREIEVLALVREGLTNREIGATLTISHTTVRRHLENVFSKLDVGTRTGAVAKAFPSPSP